MSLLLGQTFVYTNHIDKKMYCNNIWDHTRSYSGFIKEFILTDAHEETHVGSVLEHFNPIREERMVDVFMDTFEVMKYGSWC